MKRKKTLCGTIFIGFFALVIWRFYNDSFLINGLYIYMPSLCPRRDALLQFNGSGGFMAFDCSPFSSWFFFLVYSRLMYHFGLIYPSFITDIEREGCLAAEEGVSVYLSLSLGFALFSV